jgi:hypothetical protein
VLFFFFGNSGTLDENVFVLVFERSVLYFRQFLGLPRDLFPEVCRLKFCSDLQATQCMLHVYAYLILRVEVLFMFCEKLIIIMYF